MASGSGAKNKPKFVGGALDQALLDEDDEDRYLNDILNRNYNGKAPPAVN